MKTKSLTINGKRVGSVENNILRKSGIIFKKTNSLAIELKVLQELKKMGVGKILVTLKGSKRKFETKLENFFKFGELNQYRNYEPQLFLKLEYWREIK